MTLNEMIAEAQPSGLTGHLSAKELGTIVWENAKATSGIILFAFAGPTTVHAQFWGSVE
jgi:hypothetical protein